MKSGLWHEMEVCIFMRTRAKTFAHTEVIKTGRNLCNCEKKVRIFGEINKETKINFHASLHGLCRG